MITIEINDAEITAALTRLAAKLTDMTPIMEQIGRGLVTSTKDRFGKGISPDGTAWTPNSAVTLARKKGKPPLFGNSPVAAGLNAQIFAETGKDFVEVGSTKVYAAMMQFGGTKSAFPHLWGDIPARPFLGLSDDDREEIMDIISDALGAALGD